MIAPELKNCPFCGSPHEYEPWHGGLPTKMMIMCGNRPDGSGGNCMVSPMVTGETMDEAAENWNRRTDLSQASVAAALEAAAKLCDEATAYREKQLTADGGDEATRDRWRGGKVQATLLADAIRALITPAQHDALAAHVAAEVAKARAVVPLVWKDAAPFFDDELDSVLYSEAVGAGYTYVAEAVDCTIEDAKAEQEKAYADNIMSAIAQIGAKP